MNLDGIDPRDIIKSLDNDSNRKMIFKAGESAGASGSFFFFSHDNRFIIKTLRGTEMRDLIKMLDKYVHHLKTTKNLSLLARIYGVYTIKTNFYQEVDIIIMQNSTNLQNKYMKKYSFDLKGSITNRRANFKSSILKDVNILELNRSKPDRQVVNIDEDTFEQII